MPGGKRDSSKTRVEPVFQAVQSRSDDWVRALLSIPTGALPTGHGWNELDLTFESGFWGQHEHPFAPPRRLLEWLVRHPGALRHSSSELPLREALLKGEPGAREAALTALDSAPTGRGWHLFEGTTFPDATILTPDAVIVVEGKRTEAGPTLDTSWLSGRHQMWRHIEGAWNIRGSRRVFGFFLVEGDAAGVPEIWKAAAKATTQVESLASSFPHLDPAEREELAACFLGVGTWQQVCGTFGIDFSDLPDTVDQIASGS